MRRRLGTNREKKKRRTGNLASKIHGFVDFFFVMGEGAESEPADGES